MFRDFRLFGYEFYIVMIVIIFRIRLLFVQVIVSCLYCNITNCVKMIVCDMLQ